MGQYRPMFNISMEHNYFSSGKLAGTNFVPTAATRKLMNNVNLVSRPRPDGITMFYDGDYFDALKMYAADAEEPLKVEFNCDMYIPNQNTIIEARVKTINNQLLTCSVGEKNQIIIFIPKESISTDNFNINNNYLHYESKKELKIDDTVLINLITIKVNKNDSHIKCIGYLNDISTN